MGVITTASNLDVACLPKKNPRVKMRRLYCIEPQEDDDDDVSGKDVDFCDEAKHDDPSHGFPLTLQHSTWNDRGSAYSVCW